MKLHVELLRAMVLYSLGYGAWRSPAALPYLRHRVSLIIVHHHHARTHLHEAQRAYLGTYIPRYVLEANSSA